MPSLVLCRGVPGWQPAKQEAVMLPNDSLFDLASGMAWCPQSRRPERCRPQRLQRHVPERKLAQCHLHSLITSATISVERKVHAELLPRGPKPNLFRRKGF